MWNQPSGSDLAAIPALYSNEAEGRQFKDIIIHMHFFFGGCDWYIAEYNASEGVLWGFAILNGDYQNAEWGFSLLTELESFNLKGFEIDRDIYWTPAPAIQVEKIRSADCNLYWDEKKEAPR